MTDQPDRLAEIRQRRATIADPPWAYDLLADGRIHDVDGQGIALILPGAAEGDPEFIAHAPDDSDWLVGQVEEGHAEIQRLRGLLRRLEWRGVRDLIDEQRCCPVCARRPTPGPDNNELGHAPDCWLAVEIGRS